MATRSHDSEQGSIFAYDFPEKPPKKVFIDKNPISFPDLNRKEFFLNPDPAMARQGSDMANRALFPDLPILLGESMEDFMARAIEHVREVNKAAEDREWQVILDRFAVTRAGAGSPPIGIRGQGDKDSGSYPFKVTLRGPKWPAIGEEPKKRHFSGEEY